MENFDVYFCGEILTDADPNRVRSGVAKLFKIQESAVDRLFSGKPVRVKQAVDADTASRYRAAFREAGALIQIVPAGSAAPAAKPAQAPAAQSTGSTSASSPPTTGQSTDAAAPDLAEPGAIIDHTPPPPPAEIDTGALEALPPNSGTLEDCRVEKEPRAIPDISHLQLVDD